MSTKINLSVIIPVYNGEKYIEEAILSAVSLPQVHEVIVVNDGSSDSSLEILQSITKQHKKLIILHHPDRKNRGRSASRNLGIQHASADYIAFLDADDRYLPNRFEREQMQFEQGADGVYGATIAFFETESAKHKFHERFTTDFSTVTKHIESPDLFKKILFGGSGHFTTDAITVRKELLLQAGGFDTEVDLGEDTQLWLKIALLGDIVAGEIKEPIAERRVHDNNSIHSGQELLHKNLETMYWNLLFWCINYKMTFNVINDIFIALKIYTYKNEKSNMAVLFCGLHKKITFGLSYFFLRKTLLSLFK